VLLEAEALLFSLVCLLANLLNVLWGEVDLVETITRMPGALIKPECFKLTAFDGFIVLRSNINWSTESVLLTIFHRRALLPTAVNHVLSNEFEQSLVVYCWTVTEVLSMTLLNGLWQAKQTSWADPLPVNQTCLDLCQGTPTYLHTRSITEQYFIGLFTDNY
jgi:hypothetical protein